jgi:hypothetical protein
LDSCSEPETLPIASVLVTRESCCLKSTPPSRAALYWQIERESGKLSLSLKPSALQVHVLFYICICWFVDFPFSGAIMEVTI